MTILPSNNKWDISSFLMHLFGFLILLEWLRPLIEITDMVRLNLFTGFIGICFILSFFQTRFQISIKIVVILFMIHSVDYKGPFIHPAWLVEFLSDFFHNIRLLFQANWWDLSKSFQTFLFFLVLWFSCFLTLYWLIHQKRGLLFLTLTVIYITIFDIFGLYDMNKAIIRTIITGLFMLSLLQIERMKPFENLQKHTKSTPQLLIPIAVSIIFTITIGYFAPKPGPQLSNIDTFFRFDTPSANKETTINKVGYGMDDSQLGGPFKWDDTVVFTAQMQNSQYWRVETKDFYTGKGWEISDNPKKISFKNKNNVLSWYEQNTKTETAEAIITMQKDSPHLIYPAGLVSVEAASDVSFRADPFSEKIDMMKEGSSTTLNKYKVTYKTPHFSIENLKAVKAAEGLEASSYFIEKYTQLPDSLPKRVKDLAINLTKDKNNRYDQVLAVESYFANNSFVYETEHVKVPGKDQDYADQFIFDTKSGYCNNFSTSMIVLLRSIGIPARWVKGYTGGTLENKVTNSDYENIYTIDNNNAHSWVEVYFPGYGWVPFEPTKGFSNPYNFTHDASAPTATSPNSETTIPSNEQTPQRNAETKQKNLIEDTEVLSNGKIMDSKKGFSWGYLFLCIISISITGYALFTTRIKWFAFFIILSYKYRKGDDVYAKAYDALLKQLERTGISRNESQTLREYAIHVDNLYNSTDMQKLTLSYENVIYQNHPATSEWRRFIQLWEKLMKKASSPPKSNEFDTFI
ncbi:protease [Bacillus pseudomycoides]|uniref:DUF4129 domain-containing transglutaminase family protein n=1 Tax=Bacillus pseudomycoides TaxID=64104 RepID=UPI000BFD6A43|nr:DUF4129 domain-containing transglutaminase family protein [Bacillus pseudomycoides]PHE15069.1 protease [Bacillus pseudomycoides]